MPEEEGAEVLEEPQSPEESETPAVVETETPESEAKTFGEDYVKDLRTESAKYRKRAQEAEAKVKEQEQADLSAIEKAEAAAKDATGRVTQLENLLHAERTRNAVTLAAAKMSFRDASDALSMIDTDDLTYDDETGKPTAKSINGALQRLAKDKPYLVDTGAGSADGGARGDTGEITEETKLAERTKHLRETKGTVPIPALD